ncbi:MAG TPA: hypothetical protein VGF75_00310 [Candidatus Saccharimonadales bacterium]|jgi:hypothetical protein
MPLSIRKLSKTITNPDEMQNLQTFVFLQVDYLLNKTRMLRENLLPKWVKTYKGRPEVERKTFPWPEASNLVIQLAATHADELLSRVMAIFQAEQLYIAQILGDFEKGVGDDEREIIEKFMGDQAWSPIELDMYRVEEAAFSSAIRYGTGIVKIPFKYQTEQVYTGSISNDPFSEEVIQNGPKPENVPLNKFLIDTQRPTLRSSDFIVHITTYKRHELKNLIDSIKDGESDGSSWDKKALEEIYAGSCDRAGPDYYQEVQEEPKGMNNYTPQEASGEFDFCECWFAYMYGGKRYRCIVNWHHKTQKMVGGLFNSYPQNQVPFEDAKLAYDDDQYYGYGFMEMLDAYQREVSTVHNQRIDNRNLANTGALRISNGSKLASIIQIYPGVVIPGNKDEVEPLALGATAAPITTEDEQLTLALAKERSGVDPAQGGTGGGVVNAKRGIYSAQGTAIAMQATNNRNTLRMSDMRSAHVRIGIKILEQYAYFGVDGKLLRKYGTDAVILKKALDSYKDGKLGLLIKPATASTNRELEKQNDILMMQTMSNAQNQDMQMIAQLQTPNMPPDMAEYIISAIQAKNVLLRRLFRAFNHQDVDRLAPLPPFIQKMREQAMNGQQQQAAPQRSAGVGGQRQLTGGNVPVGGRGSFGSIPQLSDGSGAGGPIQ